MGKDITVHGIFDEMTLRRGLRFRKFYEENPDTHEVVQYQLGLEAWGCARLRPVIMSSHRCTDIIRS